METKELLETFFEKLLVPFCRDAKNNLQNGSISFSKYISESERS